MPARRKKPLARGFVNKKILESLLDGDKYGYEIIKEVKEKSDGKIELKQPSLYSSLKRFEQKGLISSYWGDSDIGGRRHYYSITEVGKNYYFAENSGSLDDFDDDDIVENEEKASQIEIVSPTLEYSDVYEEVHGGFEIDEASDQDDKVAYEVSKEEISSTNKYLTDDILEQMKRQYSIDDITTEDDDTTTEENVEEVIETTETKEEAKTVTIHFDKVESYDQHIQQDLFDTLPTQSISNDEVMPNFEQMQEIKQQETTPDNVVEEEKPKKEIPLIEERPINYHDWEDMKKQATTKKSFDDNQDEAFVVSDSIKKQYNSKVFLDEDERIDVSDNINVSLNKSKDKDNELRFELSEETTSTPYYSEHKKDDVDYKSILSHLYDNNDEEEETPNDYEEMVSKELSSAQVEDDEEEEYIPQPERTKYYFNSNSDLIKDLKIKYYEPTLKEVADNNFVKINKVNLISTALLAPVLCLQALIIMIIQLVNSTLLVSGKLPIVAVVLYIIAFSMALLLPIGYAFAYLINPTKKTKRTYLTKNFVWNGMIALFASLLLILTINMLCGCRASNWHNFYAQICVPAILTTNFVIYPLIKGLVMRKIK